MSRYPTIATVKHSAYPRKRGRRGLFVAGLFVVVTLLAAGIRQNTFSFVQPVLFASVFVTFAALRPVGYLVTLTVAAELFSSFPPGTLLALIWLPVLVRKLFPKVEVDLSFSFLLLVGGVVALQLLILAAVDQWLIWPVQGVSALGWFQAVPFLGITFSLIGTSLLTYVSLVAWKEVI